MKGLLTLSTLQVLTLTVLLCAAITEISIVNGLVPPSTKPKQNQVTLSHASTEFKKPPVHSKQISLQRLQTFSSSILSRTKKTIGRTIRHESSENDSEGGKRSSSSSSYSVLDRWKEYEYLRTSNLDQDVLDDFFSKRPHIVAQRLAQVSSTLLKARYRWRQGRTSRGGNYEEEEEDDDDDIFFAAQSNATSGKDGTTETNRANELCSAVSSLGPVAVKIGQTLSQRPDLVGHEAARALQRLQTNNEAYPNEWAYKLIRNELKWTNGAPLSPEIAAQDDAAMTDPNAKPLFAKMTVDPVACASLGQVYKATLWDGREVAVKVQRPDAMSILAKDMQCFRTVFGTRRKLQKFLENNQDNSVIAEKKQDIGSIIDRVGKDILKELNYTLEAQNSKEFRDSLEFLGFVTTPNVIEECSTQRVLLMEWVQGDPLSNLSKEQGLEMTRMAVEACTASMVLTGFMHSDPHEGNLMLHKDGRVVFLDFGLMSRVDEDIMEGFARGIQALLSEDWKTLAEAFVDVGFVSDPIMHRSSLDDIWREDPNFGIPELAQDLAKAMDEVEGGKARFGSLATVLNKKISPTWLVYTPPYVLLLVRTFLTLEGIAAKVDPGFNIYEMAMPWAVRRALSPSTEKGIGVFRSTIMTSDNRIQWARFLELAGGAKENKDEAKVALTSADEIAQASSSNIQPSQATQDALKAAVASLLGSPNGRALRRALKDLDSTDLLDQLSTKEGRGILKKVLAASMASLKNKNWDKGQELQGEQSLTPARRYALTPPAKQVDQSDISKEMTLARPVSNAYVQMRFRESKWRRQVSRILLWTHFRRQLRLRGFKSIFKFTVAVLRVATSLFASKIKRLVRRRPKVLGTAALT